MTSIKNFLPAFFFTLFGCYGNTNDYREIVTIIKYVESNNDPKMIGDNGDSYGAFQIQENAVLDVNRYFGTKYTHQQMLNPDCGEEVTILYMRMGAELYEKKYGKKPTEEVLVRNHNGGIYRGYRKKSTLKYYKKYLKFKEKLKN